MSVTVTKTAGNRAEITWDPRTDDPSGYIARAVESEQLACALQSLGDDREAALEDPDESYASLIAMHTTALARLLERRAAVQVVRLRNVYGMSWRRIATVIHDDPEMQSTVRRQFDAGLRHLGLSA